MDAAAGNGVIMAADAPTVTVYVQDLMAMLPRVPPFGHTSAERAAMARLKAAADDPARWLSAPPEDHVSLRQLIASARQLVKAESLGRNPEYERGIAELITDAAGLGKECYQEIRRVIGLEVDSA